VAGIDADEGVISPGGVGYDINCGVRLLRTDLRRVDLDDRGVRALVEEFYRTIPTGAGVILPTCSPKPNSTPAVRRAAITVCVCQ